MLKGMLDFYKGEVESYLKEMDQEILPHELNNACRLLNSDESCSVKEGRLIIKKTNVVKIVDVILAKHVISTKNRHEISVLFITLDETLQGLRVHFMKQNELITRHGAITKMDDGINMLRELGGIDDSNS